MDVLVTGGAGFIGSNLVRCLVASGERVRVLDDLSTGSVDNLHEVGGLADMIVADVRDARTVRRAVEGAEVVYHLAALPSVARSVEDPLTTHAVNAGGTLNVLHTALDAGVRRVVYASSSAVYGDAPGLPKTEESPLVPGSPYAASKLAAESYCGAFARAYEIETVSLRFFNVFGPRQDPGSEYAAVVPRFLSRMLAGEPPIVFGDGTQSRDFTYVGNAVQACILAASAGPAAVGRALNVGCGVRTSLLELVELANEVLGARMTPVFQGARAGDVRHSVAAIAAAQRVLGYRPLVGLREGLRATVRELAGPVEADPRPTVEIGVS